MKFPKLKFGVTGENRKMKLLIISTLFLFNTLSAIAGQDAVVYQYSGNEPKLEFYYLPPEQPVNAVTPFDVKLEEKSFVQEFDIEFGQVDANGSLQIGNRSFQIHFMTNTIIIFDRYLGTKMAVKDRLKLMVGDLYHTKFTYNAKDLKAGCIVSDKKTSEIIWNSGEKVCAPAIVPGIYYAVSGESDKATAPFSGIKWDAEKRKLKMSAAHDDNVLVCWIDNMQLRLTD